MYHSQGTPKMSCVQNDRTKLRFRTRTGHCHFIHRFMSEGVTLGRPVPGHPGLLRPFLNLGFPVALWVSPARNHPPPRCSPIPNPAAQCTLPSYPNRAHQPVSLPRAIRLSGCRIHCWCFKLHSWTCDTDSIRIHLSHCIPNFHLHLHKLFPNLLHAQIYVPAAVA